MTATPHLDKLNAALSNPKCAKDRPLLNEAKALYSNWIADLDALTAHGKSRVVGMVKLLNEYKEAFEVELVMKRGSDFLRRQKGQLKLDNSILEEFLIRLVHPDIIQGLGDTQFITGPQNAFMSLSFRPHGFSTLDGRPEVACFKFPQNDLTLWKDGRVEEWKDGREPFHPSTLPSFHSQSVLRGF